METLNNNPYRNGSPMTVAQPEVVNDFSLLFRLVCAKHTGPVRVDFGRQRSWDGIIAGQCKRHIQFLQADGINAFLDTKARKMIFREGTPQQLSMILTQQLAKVRGADLVSAA